MPRRSTATSVAALALASVIAVPAASGAATRGTGGAPVVERQQSTYRLTPDDFFNDLCGITTSTTVKEFDLLKTWPDGSQSFHVERSFVPDDRRLPIERGAGTSYFAADGTLLRISGKPIQLLAQRGGGVLALDAGLTLVGDPTVAHGHIDVGLGNENPAPFYCLR